MITKYILLSVLLSLGVKQISAQPVNYKYEILGTIKSDTGKIKLIPIPNLLYYPSNTNSMEAPIDHGKFTFSGYLLYPYTFQLLSSDGSYLSNIFFIDSGKQSLICDVDSLREVPMIKNPCMEEYRNDYLPSFTALNIKYDKYEERIVERRKYLLNYILSHPDSYVSLWELAYKLIEGYEPILDTSFENLSNRMKTTVTGKILKEHLISAKETSNGGHFPILTVLDTHNKERRIPEIEPNPKYIFIDFWFSHCSSCIGQFPQLKSIYQNYKSADFDMLSISTDNKKDMLIWKEAIQKYALPWDQYLDTDGLNAEKLSINLFPTNFLIDRNGVIIAKNIEPKELESLLSGLLRH